MTNKKIKFLILGAAAVSMTACGATTNGLGKAMAQKAAAQAVASQLAAKESPDDVTTATVTTQTTTTSVASLNMAPECQAIANKVADVDARISAANDIINGGNSVGGEMAASVASTAAVHSGAAQVMAKVPFGGLFAKAAMDGVAKSGEKKMKNAQKDLNKATLERAKLEGMYAGKGC